jgi:hypothetical protein
MMIVAAGIAANLSFTWGQLCSIAPKATRARHLRA